MNSTSEAPLSSGLEGVVVAKTQLSQVDGVRGRLVLRGRAVEDLAGHHPFEAGMNWLKTGTIPNEAEQARIRTDLGRARVAAYERLGTAHPSHVMDALRGAVAHLEAPFQSSAQHATDIIATMSVAAAAWARRQAGQPTVPPSADIGHAADFLKMTCDRTPTPVEAAALDAYWLTVIDHGLNASTFAARVVTSTGSDVVSAVTAAIGALKGPLHGGAPGPVLDMLDAIGTPERARPWLEAQLEKRARIMGMGHRVYRVRDPRAAVLERAVRTLENEGPNARLTLARAVEQAAETLLAERYPDRPLKANVEFYTALLLDVLGLPRALFTATFAASRVVGWLAHIDEQKETGRLIRPASRYIGPPAA